MRAPRLADERGIALAVAVFALVVIGALVAGIFFAGRLEQQTGMNTFFAAQAAEAAEAGLNEAIASQSSGALLALPIDPDPADASSLGSLTVNAGSRVTAARTINRLSDNLFLVRSLGTRADANGAQLAARSIGQLIRLVQADIEVKAGLTALGNVTITGGAEVSGMDAVPPTWDTG
ncbi:MAG: hypothetical protein M3Q93_13825, partial [Gemmatimonadota bacterium]|nr:hypothetical protein [Gemmatimonadota bacterium]